MSGIVGEASDRQQALTQAIQLVGKDSANIERVMRAVDVLNRYYDAINRHSVQDMLEAVHPEVEVRFLQPERNWSGKQQANDKFAGWFERCPDVRAAWKFESVQVHDGNNVELKLHCSFHPDPPHAMGYQVGPGDLICLIEHL